MSDAVILDLKDEKFGHLIRGILNGKNCEAELFDIHSKKKLKLKHLKTTKVVFLGKVPKKIMETLMTAPGVSLIRVGQVKEEYRNRYHEIIPRPIALNKLDAIMTNYGLVKKRIFKPVARRGRKSSHNLSDIANEILHSVGEGNETRSEILGAITKDIPQTAWAQAIKMLVKDKQVIRKGKKRGARYYLPE